MAFAMQDNIMGAPDLYAVDNVGPGPFNLVGSLAGKMGRYGIPSAFVDAVDPVFGGGQFILAQVAPMAAQTVSGVAVAAGVATVTTGAAHGLSVGAVVDFAGFAPSGYNGLWTVASVPSTTTFTLNLAYLGDQRWNPNNPNVANKLTANPAVPTAAPTTIGTYVPGIGAGQVVQFVHAADAFGNLILQATPWVGTANSGLSLGVSLANPLATTTSSNPSNAFGGQFGWFQVSGAAVTYCSGAPAIGAQCYWNNAGGSGKGGAVQSTAVASKQAAGIQFASAAGASFGSGTSGLIALPANMAIVWGTFPCAQGAIT